MNKPIGKPRDTPLDRRNIGVLERFVMRGRVIILRLRGASVSSQARLYALPRVTWAPGLTIEAFASINNRVTLHAEGGITIREHARISDSATLETRSLLLSDGCRNEHVKAPIIIERFAWIATGAVVARGVTVGERSVVSANSLLRRDLPADTIAEGVPAAERKNSGSK